MIKKVCPLKFGGKEGATITCEGERCGWHITGQGCSIPIMALELKKMNERGFK